MMRYVKAGNTVKAPAIVKYVAMGQISKLEDLPPCVSSDNQLDQDHTMT